MKNVLLFFLSFSLIVIFSINSYAAADITFTSVAVPAGNMNQGSTDNVIYIAKMEVATENVTVISIQVTINGSYTNTDLGVVRVYYNLTAPNIATATLGGSVAGNFAGPHAFSIPGGRAFTAGSTVYIIITANINATATDNHTLNINGAINPLTITASVPPNVTNSQTDVAGVQTIQASDITFTSIAVPAGNMNQGSADIIIYIAKMDIGTEPVTVSNVLANLNGSYSSTDLGVVKVYYNLTAPNLTTAALGGTVAGSFAGPHVFSIPAGRVLTAGSTVYIIITVNIVNTATDNHTVFIDGATAPVTITATTAPNFTDNQTNAAGIQTIQAADITFTSIAVPAVNMNQGSADNIIYITKMDIGTEPVTVSNVLANLNGTYDNTDLGVVKVYYNLTAPNIATAALGGAVAGSFAGPHVFSIPAGRAFTAGSTVYIIITANITNTATDNHTVFIDGATAPVAITATTAPNFADNQTNAAGIQTIQAADIGLSTIASPAGSLNPGSTGNIIYIAKMNVGTEPVTVSNVLINLSGTYDNNDLGNINVYYNLTAPNLATAVFGGGVPGNFAGPHAFSIPAGRSFAAGNTVYVIITANIISTATDNHTIFIDGAADPLTISATTVPNIIHNQTNIAGVQTIQAADIILSTVNLPAGNILPGTNGNIIYALKMDVGTQPVLLNNIQVTIDGNYDNNDLGNLSIYYNTTAPNLTTASLLSNTPVTVAGPHTFSIPTGRSISAGTTSYIVFAVSVSSGATLSNTVAINGAASPVILGFTTTPNIANNQSNAAGVFNIGNAALPLKLTSFNANKTNSGGQVQLQWTTASETNTKNFDVQWRADGSSFTSVGTISAQGNSQTDKHYSFVHPYPLNGVNNYRLKMIDIDGQFTYSPVVSVKITAAVNNIIIAPNPVGNQVRIIVNNAEPVKLLRIYNINGTVVWQSAIQNTTGIITVPFSSFSNGMYNAEVTTQHTVQRSAFIKAGK